MTSVIADSVFATTITAAGASGHVLATDMTAINIETTYITAK